MLKLLSSTGKLPPAVYLEARTLEPITGEFELIVMCFSLKIFYHTIYSFSCNQIERSIKKLKCREGSSATTSFSLIFSGIPTV